MRCRTVATIALTGILLTGTGVFGQDGPEPGGEGFRKPAGHHGAPLSVAIIAREFTAKMMNRGRDRYLKLFQQLAAWLGKQVIDELFLWFRTVSDPVEVGRQTRQVADLVRGRCPLIVELSCYHVGSFQDPKLMLEAARRAKDNGADSVGMYRAHAVDQLNFWPLVEEISKMS